MSFQTAEYWKSHGVTVYPIRNIRGQTPSLDKDEQETAFNYIETDDTGEFMTSDLAFQTHVENVGIKPTIINTYSNVETRVYQIPRSSVRLSFKRGRRQLSAK